METGSPGLGAKIDSQMCYRVKPGYALREVVGEYLTIPVALDPGEASRISVLNEEGKFLWELLRQDRSLEELVQAMTEDYEVSPEDARSDILEFIEQLRANSLLLMKREGEK